MFEQTNDSFGIGPRRETFLARYPRNLKLAVTALLLAALILPPAWIHGHGHAHNENVAGIIKNDQADAAANLPVINPKNVSTVIGAPSLNDQDDRTVKLVSAPDSRITEDTAEGSLPRVSEDGLHPWQVYARPFNAADRRPRVAIVVTGLGMSRVITDEVITQLPPTVTLAFASQGPVVAAWGGRARQDGHEILLQIPMEPFDFPRSDPGPGTLLSSLPNSDNLARLMKALRSATGYVGVTSINGSRFTTDSTKLAPVLDLIHKRGLMVLDARAAPHSVVTDMARNDGIPAATVTQRLDSDLSPEGIAAALDDLEKTARQNGRAVGITSATPIMISQLQAWAKTLPQHGIALAPISAMVQ